MDYRQLTVLVMNVSKLDNNIRVENGLASAAKGPFFGKRHLQIILLFMAAVVSYWSRVNVSMAVVAMTSSNTKNTDFEEFDWNEQEKSYILSSFYWGYTITQLPGGLLSKKYGSKYLLLGSILFPSILAILTPLCASYGGWQLFCAVRVVQGLGNGVIFPVVHTHLSKWSPIEERNRLGAFAYSGVELGTIIAFFSSGLLAASKMGWPGIFYVPGGVGLIWSIVWVFYGANTPDDVPSISIAEKKHIQASLGSQSQEKTSEIPWVAIFTSVPFISLIIVRLSHSWGFTMLLTELPTYMNSILLLDISSNALFSALPYIVMWTLSLLFIALADIFAKGKCMSLSIIRKFFSSIGQWIPALALIGLAFVDVEEVPLGVTLITIAVGANSACTLGSTLNHIDLAPNHAGPLMGIANSLANLISIIVPLVVGVVVANEKDQSQWQVIFYISAGIFLIGNLIFIIFGEAKTQPWNETKTKKDNNRRPSLFVETHPHVIS